MRKQPLEVFLLYKSIILTSFLYAVKLPYIPESNQHPNLIRTSFADFLKEKKIISRF